MIKNGLPFITDQAEWSVLFIGIAEVLFGFIWLFYQNKRQLFGLQIIIFPLLTFGAILAEPDYLIHPFNPLTFNLSLFTLSIIGFLLSKDIPTTTSCKRQRVRN
ncbi:DoxX-like family protein [Peribacillus loiseleuriae]|uniref:DoxX-like family protein n=1 Tax=Peribacillus loiseleuriae TaxID=1679170 RepID=UPI003D011996